MEMEFILYFLFLIQRPYGYSSGVAPLIGCKDNLQSDYNFNTLFSNDEEREQVLIKTLLHNSALEKDTYNSVTTHKKCGLNVIQPLLPLHRFPNALKLGGLSLVVSSTGSLEYFFNGTQAVRFPSKQLPLDWFKKYTITMWLKVNAHNGRQYVLSWSKGQQLNTMGFFVARHPDSKQTIFGFHHAADVCTIRTKWKLIEDEAQWHFVTLSFENCSVELTVDREFLAPFNGKLQYRTPANHLQPKFVLGASWTGSVTKYADFFHGALSGLLLLEGHSISTQKLDCLLHFQQPVNDFVYKSYKRVLLIEGSTTKHGLENLLNSIVYRNVNVLQIDEAVVTVTRSPRRNVRIKFDTPNTVIQITGNCTQRVISLDDVKRGVKMCPDLRVVSCAKENMDSLSIRARLSKHETFYVDEDVLSSVQLNVSSLDDGLVVYGYATTETYSTVIANIKFLGLSESPLREVTFLATSRNGLVQSNRFTAKLEISNNIGPVLQPLSEMFHVDRILPYERLATSTFNKSTADNALYMVLASLFILLVLLALIGFLCYARKSTSHHLLLVKDIPDFAHLHYAESIRINTAERVCVSNDPYSDILEKQRFFDDTTSDGSVYSDDGDNDSIRQLEWDDLENCINSVLQNEKLSVKNKFAYVHGNFL